MSNKRSRESIVDLTLQEAVRNADEDILAESTTRAEKINQALSKFSDEELTRFEFYMRSHLRKNKVKDILKENLGSKFNVTDEMCIAVGGLAKLFVGELMHYSMEVLEQQQDNDNNSNNIKTSLRIEHIEEAVFRMKKDGKIGRASEDAFLFSKNNMKSESFASELMHSDLFDYSDDDDDDNDDNNNNNSSTSMKR